MRINIYKKWYSSIDNTSRYHQKLPSLPSAYPPMQVDLIVSLMISVFFCNLHLHFYFYNSTWTSIQGNWYLCICVLLPGFVFVYVKKDVCICVFLPDGVPDIDLFWDCGLTEPSLGDGTVRCAAKTNMYNCLMNKRTSTIICTSLSWLSVCLIVTGTKRHWKKGGAKK